MDTIVTPVTVITLDSTRIVHNIKADLVARYFPPVVRLVQYDQSLPVIAVSLMQNGQTYTLPSGAAANIRVHKPDATYVYNPALGCDSTRNIVYFEVTQAMAAANGDGLAIVEIVVDGDIAGTSLITLHFEENPVPEDAIESSDEWETIYELGERIIASTVTPVSTAAGMTDHNVVYLYTGTESGWNQGHMYYYNGTTWVDAGIAVTDTTLSVAGLAADAKKTGDEITALKEDLTAVESDVTDLKEDYAQILDSAYVTDTASGAIASFPDGADGVPVKSLTVNIEPVQSGSGDPSPTNIRPISGHTSAVVTRTGKNLFDSSLLSDVASSIKYVTVTIKPNTQYTMSSTIPIQGGNTANLFFMLPSETASSGTNGVNINRPVTLTTGADGQAKVGYRLGDNTVSQYLAYNFQIEVGSTATEYNAYSQPQTVTIDLGGTRYGGTLDVGTGVLTVDRGYHVVSNSDTARLYSASLATGVSRIGIVVSDMKAPTWNVTEEELDVISNIFTPNTAPLHNASASAVGQCCLYKDGSYPLFVAAIPTAASANDAKSWLVTNGCTFVYPLDTPFTVQLTANEISTLLGQNNIFADTGDVEVEYRADTKLYIEKLTAPTEDDMIADHAISANSFFMVGNTLYRATTAIASGATITVGTNATKLSLSDALNALS